MRIRTLFRRRIHGARHAFQRTRERGKDVGMVTAEYAVGIVTACGFGTLLMVLLRSAEIRSLLFGIIRKALSNA